jgi:preprotein translocase subunit SecG
MKSLFNLITVISAILMVVSILVQNRGQSLGTSFGGDNSSYRSKRGSELVIYNATIVLAIIFTLSIILGIIFKK